MNKVLATIDDKRYNEVTNKSTEEVITMTKTNLKTSVNVLSTLHQLKTLGIVVTMFGNVEPSEKGYAYEAMIRDLIENTPFFLGVTTKQICTLCLAEYQEDCNNFIDQSEIDFVNSFFEFEEPITYEEVQEFNSKCI